MHIMPLPILNKQGMTQVAKNGFLTARPELAIQKDAYDKILRASAQLMKAKTK